MFRNLMVEVDNVHEDLGGFIRNDVAIRNPNENSRNKQTKKTI